MFDREQLNQLYQYSLSLTNHSANAYDLLQTALEKFIKLDLQRIDSHMSYMRRTIRNQYIDECRRNKIVDFEPIEDVEALSLETRSLDQVMIDINEIEHIWRQLNASEREILYLWAVLGYSSSEIAKETNSPRGTILSRIHRLKQKIDKHQSTFFPNQDKADQGGNQL